jgi:hypothetical protein
MNNKTVETETPVTTTPPLPAWELPSLDRIQIQAIMAAILYVGQKPAYDPKSHRHEAEVKAAVKIATDLLLRVEQEEHDYLRRRSANDSYLRPSVQSQE